MRGWLAVVKRISSLLHPVLTTKQPDDDFPDLPRNTLKQKECLA